MIDLNELTKGFGEAYSLAKETDAYKKHMQDLLFEGFTEVLNSGLLANRLLPRKETDGDPKEIITKYFPGWRYVQHQEDHILIEEDPALMRYVFVNEETGMVYGRTIVEGGPSLDDAALKEENPSLWEELTEWPDPWYTLVKDVFEISLTSTDEIEDKIGEVLRNHDVQRTIKDPNLWTESQAEQVKKYMYPGKITVRLVPPRKATADELGQ